MKFKLIVCDVDETLLNDQKEVSTMNYEAIQHARDLGVKFVLASGRGFTNLQTVADVLNIKDTVNEYTISFNGGVTTENKDNKILSVNGLNFTQLKQLFEIGLSYDVGFHIYTLTHVYFYHINEDERNYVHGRLNGYVELTNSNIDFLKNESVIKILFHNNDRDYLHSIEKSLPVELLSQFSISYSANRYLEFNQQGVSKGIALLNLAKKLNIEPAEVIAIGDNNNDISMLKIAGLGIAVANATPDAKASAREICEVSNNQSAIAHIINKYIIN